MLALIEVTLKAWSSQVNINAILLCMVLQYYSVLLPYSLSVCEQAEKLEVLDHAFSVTSMSASIGQ